MNADSQVGLAFESEDVELAVEVFSMLADATRVRIILALRDEELSVNHLADLVEKSPAAVSQHLAKLRLARIVATRQDGTRVFYRLANEHARQLVADAIFQAQHALDANPAHHHAEVALQFLVDIHQRRRPRGAGLHGEAETMRLAEATRLPV